MVGRYEDSQSEADIIRRVANSGIQVMELIPNYRTPPHAPVPDAITTTEPVEWAWDNSKLQATSSGRPSKVFQELRHLQAIDTLHCGNSLLQLE
ncbi:hypothetical protein AVEN_29315-1 [Araneus ventricosus]|uniref:Uncharacterized protein n=1 Tax=Araneus ventricosus TaxID=182803 RepID=A0A4Y2WUB2_ARAVE|nr:hypothetical protein AVEN_29315-1 [Araneus ventricosus]